MYQIPDYHLSIFIGLLLSDAGFISPSKKNMTINTNFAIQLGAKFENLNFILDTFLKLAPFCSKFPRIIFTSRNNKLNTAVYFNTRYLPCFTKLRNFFYLNDKKEIPIDIFNLLDPIALAY
jgi:LAGLIDADG DNA endonuclease family